MKEYSVKSKERKCTISSDRIAVHDCLKCYSKVILHVCFPDEILLSV